MLPNRKKIGILGGGQLGKMLIEASRPWNIYNTILESKDAPAKEVANEHIIGSLYSKEDIKLLAEKSDVLTFEIEHLNVDALKELAEQGKEIVPSPEVLEIIQDKGLQKLFYHHQNIPTADFHLVKDETEWKEKLSLLTGEKVVAKLRTGGYDGKGVTIINKKECIENINKIPFKEPVVLEQFIDNAKEISVIVAKDKEGFMQCFPLVEMEFNEQSNLVEFLFSPAEISLEVENILKKTAMDAVKPLKGRGMFAVEMFYQYNTNKVFVNEIAPRPHNSGHHTIECCYTSQFEQLNRILLNMPLGNTDLVQPAAMINLVGPENVSGEYQLENLEEVLKIRGVYIHLYNKTETRPNRKLGHITILAPTLDEVKYTAQQVREMVKIAGV